MWELLADEFTCQEGGGGEGWQGGLADKIPVI